VRRVPDLNPANQSELFTVFRYHAVFTESPLPMLEAEKATGSGCSTAPAPPSPPSTRGAAP